MKLVTALLLMLLLATSAFALEKRAYQMGGDFGTEPSYDCALSYYYYVPCPTYSWFWAFTGWSPGDIVGTCFTVGDQGTGNWPPCDSEMCQCLMEFRVLDFAGYGVNYPGLWTVEFDLFCVPEVCCGPTSPMVHVWNSGPRETAPGWNNVHAAPLVSLSECCIFPLPDCSASFVLTATMTGTDGAYPAWGLDNISSALETGCAMHDIGCLPAVYPRGPCGEADPKVHSGFIGHYPLEYWPPLMFTDGRDTTPGASMFGGVDLAWRVYLWCVGPVDGAMPATWGSIKAMYE
jgi:hypothetical protein